MHRNTTPNSSRFRRPKKSASEGSQGKKNATGTGSSEPANELGGKSKPRVARGRAGGARGGGGGGARGGKRGKGEALSFDGEKDPAKGIPGVQWPPRKWINSIEELRAECDDADKLAPMKRAEKYRNIAYQLSVRKGLKRFSESNRQQVEFLEARLNKNGPELDTVTINAMMGCYATLFEDGHGALKWFAKFKESLRHRPDGRSLNILLNFFTARRTRDDHTPFEEMDRVWELSKETGAVFVPSNFAIPLTSCAYFGDKEGAMRWFRRAVDAEVDVSIQMWAAMFAIFHVTSVSQLAEVMAAEKHTFSLEFWKKNFDSQLQQSIIHEAEGLLKFLVSNFGDTLAPFGGVDANSEPLSLRRSPELYMEVLRMRADMHDAPGVERVWKLMLENHVLLNEEVFSHTIQFYSNLGQLGTVRRYFELSRTDNDVGMTPTILKAVMSGLTRHNVIEVVDEIFELSCTSFEMVDKELLIKFMDAYARVGEADKVEQIARMFEAQHLPANVEDRKPADVQQIEMVRMVVYHRAGDTLAYEMLYDANSAMVESDMSYRYLTLGVKHFSSCGRVDKALEALELLEQQGSNRPIHYVCVIVGMAEEGNEDGIEEMLERMNQKRIHPDVFVFHDIISAFMRTGHVSLAQKWYDGLYRYGIEPHPHTVAIMERHMRESY